MHRSTLPGLFTLLWLAALSPFATALSFGLASSELQFGGCQAAVELGVARSEIECLVLGGRTSLLTSFDPDTGRCWATSHCDVATLTDGVAATGRAALKRDFLQSGAARWLLFSVKAGSGVQPNASYASSAVCNNSLLLLPPGQQPASPLWRSCWLDRLAEIVRRLDMSSITVHVVKSSSDVMNITFGASPAGLDMWNWFRKDNVISYWPASLNVQSSSYNFFSVVGFADYSPSTLKVRTFYINIAWGTCSGDYGSLVVAEAADPCSYALGALPTINYNTDSTKTWLVNGAKADYLLVSVQ